MNTAHERLSPESGGVLRDIREALLGSQQDFTEGSLDRAILILAVPMVLEMVMESLFAVVDVFFVARLGKDAVTAVGLTESMMAIVFSVAMGLGIAATAIVARRTGEKDREAAALAGVQSIWLGLVAGAVFAVTGVALAPKLLGWMGAAPPVIATGAGYTRMLFGGSTSVILLFIINAVFRGAGDAAVAMRTLWLANGINIALNPCLIFGLGPFPELGVTGSAVATTIGRSVGVLYQLSVLAGGKGRIAVSRRHWVLDFNLIARLVRLAVNGAFQYLVGTASWVVLTRMVAFSGSAASAGYTIALRIIVFALLPSWGLSNAAATLVGQNLGAGKPDRAARSVWRTGLYNMVFLGLVTVVFVTLAEPLVKFFTHQGDVVAIGVDSLRYISCGYIAYAWGMVMVQAFNGAGDTRTPTLINICCYWCFQIPLAWWLTTRTSMTYHGVLVAVVVAETVLAAAGIILFRQGKWKQQRV